MNVTQTYLVDNGYDYFGNAAEDTLMFFVYKDSPSSTGEEPGRRSNEAITNLSDDTVSGIFGGLSAETTATNTEIHAEAYKENGRDTSANFSIGRDNSAADNEYTDAPVPGSAVSQYSNTDAYDLSDSVPRMAEMDSQQTDTSSGKSWFQTVI